MYSYSSVGKHHKKGVASVVAYLLPLFFLVKDAYTYAYLVRMAFHTSIDLHGMVISVVELLRRAIVNRTKYCS